jgi:hypothetical protein
MIAEFVPGVWAVGRQLDKPLCSFDSLPCTRWRGVARPENDLQAREIPTCQPLAMAPGGHGPRFVGAVPFVGPRCTQTRKGECGVQRRKAA